MRKAEKIYTELAEAIAEADTIPACQVTDPEIWFLDNETVNGSYKLAKQFCNECPVKALCAEYAISAGEQFGIWGGTTPKERSKLRGLKRGRPVA